MRKLLARLDDLGGIETDKALAKWLDRAAFVFIILMFLSAPLSIAATQIAWLTGMFIWLIRLFVKPRPRLVRSPLDIPLWIFFGWSVFTSIFSYAPFLSLDKLRNVALFLIFYYVINVVKTKRAAVLLVSALIFSCLISAAWTPIERVFGRGVEIVGAKQSKAGKIGGMFGKITGNTDAAKVGDSEAEVVVTVYQKDGKTIVGRQTSKQKIAGSTDDAAKSAIDNALNQLIGKIK